MGLMHHWAEKLEKLHKHRTQKKGLSGHNGNSFFFKENVRYLPFSFLLSSLALSLLMGRKAANQNSQQDTF